MSESIPDRPTAAQAGKAKLFARLRPVLQGDGLCRPIPRLPATWE